MEKIVEKKWGYEKILSVTKDYIMKLLVVDKNKSISLQYHKKKDETWYVAEGCGTVINGNKVYDVYPGDYLHIPSGTTHRVTAIEDMVIVEASSMYIDDIVRIEED